jgi:hypothetical protein
LKEWLPELFKSDQKTDEHIPIDFVKLNLNLGLDDMNEVMDVIRAYLEDLEIKIQNIEKFNLDQNRDQSTIETQSAIRIAKNLTTFTLERDLVDFLQNLEIANWDEQKQRIDKIKNELVHLKMFILKEFQHKII